MEQNRELCHQNDPIPGKLYLIYELSSILAQTTELDSTCQIALTAITMGEGLGFNRSIVYLISNDQAYLEGFMGIGPATHDEAKLIWSGLHPDNSDPVIRLRQLVDNSLKKSDSINQTVRQHRINLLDDPGIFSRCISEKRQFIYPDETESILLSPADTEILKSSHFAVVPLLTQKQVYGVLAVDNHFSGKKITIDDIRFLSMIATLMAGAIDHIVAYGKLYRLTYELKNTRESLIRAEKMGAIGEMILYLAHEIRNPLFAISGFARRLSQDLPVDSKEKSYATIIVDETTRLEAFLKNLFDSTQHDRLDMKRCSLHSNITDILDYLSLYLEDNRIKVFLELSPDDFQIEADDSLLKQVLHNLIQNSVQAQPMGGYIKIRTSSDGVDIRCEIIDGGSGVPPDQLKIIFKPYFTTKPGGFGLGLSYVKRIIERFEGTITAALSDEGGLRIVITFPSVNTNKGVS